MPNLHELDPHFKPCIDVQIMTVGGSVLHPPSSPEIDVDFYLRMEAYLKEQVAAGRSVVIIDGGGARARARQEAVKKAGITDADTLDKYGIWVTTSNAHFIKDLLNDKGVKTLTYEFQDVEPGVVYIRGGTTARHTTDYVAVQAAISAGVNIVIKMSNTPGMHPVDENGILDTKRIINHTTYGEILPSLKDHEPGARGPDKPALELAREHGITFVAVGPDFENLKKCLCGEEFVGSVIYPAFSDAAVEGEAGTIPDAPPS